MAWFVIENNSPDRFEWTASKIPTIYRTK